MRVWDWNPFRSPAKSFSGTRAGAAVPERGSLTTRMKLALAYATNAKIYEVRKIVSGVFDIYWNRPFEIPAFDAVKVSPDVLDRYTGVYTIPGTPAKMTVTRDGPTLYIRAGAERSGVPLEATAENKFRIDPGFVFEFDAARGQLTIKRANGERVFTKEK